MPTDAYTQAVRALGDLGPLRVWSLLVTVFGDLAPDSAVDGPTLSLLMAEIGIKPEATRVALHRLRSDGWILSEKRGRTSAHRLTPKGQRDSAAARPRIYGTPDQMGRGATMFLLPEPRDDLDPAVYALIAPRLYICASGTALPPGALPLAPGALPPWLGPQIDSAPLRDGYSALHGVLAAIDATMSHPVRLSPLQTAVLRVMIVHAWRRLALKHPDLPRAAHAPDWQGHACRALVTRQLSRLERPTLDQLHPS